jgi:hypothetical protein
MGTPLYRRITQYIRCHKEMLQQKGSVPVDDLEVAHLKNFGFDLTKEGLASGGGSSGGGAAETGSKAAAMDGLAVDPKTARVEP